MRMSYLLLVHKNIEQIIKLINTLEHEKTDIFIHVDKKSKQLEKELKNKYQFRENIIFIENNISVIWGGYSQIYAVINGLKTIVNYKHMYNYIHVISGEDYCLKTSDEVYKYFEDKTEEYIEAYEIGDYKNRVVLFNLFANNLYKNNFVLKVINRLLLEFQKIFKIQNKNFKYKRLYMGNNWFSITERCAEYIVNNYEKTISHYKFVVCADEHFFQNLLVDSPFKNSILNENLRYIDWSEGKASPKVFKFEELDQIKKKNTNKIFVRKVELL